MMLIFMFLIALFQAATAGNSPFSRARVIDTDPVSQMPTEEAIDLTICLDRVVDFNNPTSPNAKEVYEKIIEVWADGIYEMSNGGNFLGNVRIFDGGRFSTACDVEWKADGGGAWAHPGAFNSGGVLHVADFSGNLDQRINYKEFAETLVHESMHYFYGLGDEYGSGRIETNTDNPYESRVRIEAKPGSNIIIITRNDLSQARFRVMVEPYRVGTSVFFHVRGDAPTGSKLPGGLKGYPGNDYTDNSPIGQASAYHQIRAVDLSDLNRGIVRLKLRDNNGAEVDITDEGTPFWWGINLAYNSASTPNSVGWSSNPSAFERCGNEELQWWNFGTRFNLRRHSPQGMNYRRADGTPTAQWDMVIQDPKTDMGLSINESWPRYWFKSLIGREPTADDIYSTTTALNYDPNTSWWPSNYVSWWGEPTACHFHSTQVDLPFMKVELAGQTEAEYAPITRKELNIIWMQEPKVEVMVVLDHSASMSLNNKMAQAKLASKWVAGGFLSSNKEYNVDNVRVGVLAFNDEISTIFPMTWAPKLSEIYSAIDNITATGNTALFDATSQGLSSFSSDPTSLKLLYVVSDGLDVSSEKSIESVIKEFQNSQVAIHTLAYGKYAQKAFLQEMAERTGGSYFEQEESLYLKQDDAVVRVIANLYRAQAIDAGNLTYVPKEILISKSSRRLFVYATVNGDIENSGVEVKTSQNVAIISSNLVDKLNGQTHIRAEFNLQGLNESDFPLTIKSTSGYETHYYLMAELDSKPDYNLDVYAEPNGTLVWPGQARFLASVYGKSNIYTSIGMTLKIKKPNDEEIWLPINDLGDGADASAGDGIYSAIFGEYDEEGTYEWSIVADNEARQAKTTYEGMSFHDQTPQSVNDSTRFRLVQSGQFIVKGILYDDHLEPPNESVINAEEIQLGSIDRLNDVDWFRIEETELGFGYTLIVESYEEGFQPLIEIFTPNDLTSPVYQNYVKPIESNKAKYALGADLVKAGNLIAIRSDSGLGKYRMLLQKTNTSALPIGRFNSLNDWNSSAQLSLNNYLPSEGESCLKIGAGYKIIESREVSTQEIPVYSKQMAIDVRLPSQPRNQWWMGTIELRVKVLSSNKEFSLGGTQNLDPYLGGWKTYEFEVPNELISLLNEPHEDVVFQIVHNSNDVVDMDNLRFIGELLDNTVGQWEPSCPGEQGCSIEDPIILGMPNGSVRVIPTSELYFETTDLPTDWNPTLINLGISSEDGSELTGYIQINESVVELSGWYKQISIPLESIEKVAFKLYNVGGRPFRINSWVQ